MTATLETGYVHIGHGEVARTVMVTSGLIVDLDDHDRIIGIETINSADWVAALVVLAMAGRLAVPDHGDLWPPVTP